MKKERKIIKLEATSKSNAQSANQPKRRVAAYARVSTSHLEQQESYQAQCEYFTKLINSRSDWEFCGIYADEGISGTSTKKREGFNQMIEDALAGKLDLIITKSISRFARNTVDTLSTIRKLKEHRVEVFFEKENIFTLDSQGELFITILSSVAQEESRNLSENTAWGIRKRYAEGLFRMGYKRFLGYNKGADGLPAVVENEATIVRYIYSRFLQKIGIADIARCLTELGVPTPGGKTKWQYRVVLSILSNEKYMGDALLQKTFCADFLTKKVQHNNGELPKYYVENSHEAIIPKDVFEYVQQELGNRNRIREGYWLRIICGQCGSTYHKIVHHSNDERYRQYVWVCRNRFRKEEPCSLAPFISEVDLKVLTQKLLMQLITENIAVVDTCRKVISSMLRRAKQREKALLSLAAVLCGEHAFSVEKVQRTIINSMTVNNPKQISFILVNGVHYTIDFMHIRKRKP